VIPPEVSAIMSTTNSQPIATMYMTEQPAGTIEDEKF